MRPLPFRLAFYASFVSLTYSAMRIVGGHENGICFALVIFFMFLFEECESIVRNGTDAITGTDSSACGRRGVASCYGH